jgi:hypothetical protein
MALDNRNHPVCRNISGNEVASSIRRAVVSLSLDSQFEEDGDCDTRYDDCLPTDDCLSDGEDPWMKERRTIVATLFCLCCLCYRRLSVHGRSPWSSRSSKFRLLLPKNYQACRPLRGYFVFDRVFLSTIVHLLRNPKCDSCIHPIVSVHHNTHRTETIHLHQSSLFYLH